MLHRIAASPFAEDVPEGTTIVDGAWWLNTMIARGLVRKADRRSSEVEGGRSDRRQRTWRNVEATIASLRRVDWENLGINFVMLFPPNTFHGAPYNFLRH